jgi:transcriptional regulator GlxA family with amidase domain
MIRKSLCALIAMCALSAGADTLRPAPAAPGTLRPPAHGAIPVAFIVSDGAVIIDFCGPWEVFQDTQVSGRMEDAFQLYTVAATRHPITASGGMKIVPDYTLEDAPAPKVIVIPAQSARDEKTLAWIRKSAKTADVTMSVCTGAFLLGKTGLLAGKAATTHHASYRTFAMEFPDVSLRRGARYVEEGNLATAGGLSSGIDLALRVVERYFGRETAKATAYQMEYQGEGWLHPDSNSIYAVARASTPDHPLCAICAMEVDPRTAPKSVFKAKNYYFCSKEHKEQFDSAPAKWAAGAP